MGNILVKVVAYLIPTKLFMMIVAWYWRRRFQSARNSPKKFSKITGVSVKQFDWLAGEIQKLDRKKSQRDNLGLTMLFFASGCTLDFWGLMYNKNAEDAIKDMNLLIFQVLEKFLVVPGKEDCTRIAAEFLDIYGIASCNGSIGLKRIEFMEQGSDFYEYKSAMIPLLVTCDKDLRFVFHNVGDAGSISEEDEYKKSTFGKAAAAGELTPDSSPSPHYFIGGPAFQACEGVVTERTAKTPQDNFAAIQELIPKAFKLLSSKWTVLKNPIAINNPDTVRSIIRTLLALHNWLIYESQTNAPDPEDEGDSDEDGYDSEEEERLQAAAKEARMAISEWLRAEAALPHNRQ